MSAPLGTVGFIGYQLDRKSTRLNSSHLVISYAVFCLKKKKIQTTHRHQRSGIISPAPTLTALCGGPWASTPTLRNGHAGPPSSLPVPATTHAGSRCA